MFDNKCLIPQLNIVSIDLANAKYLSYFTRPFNFFQGFKLEDITRVSNNSYTFKISAYI